MKKIFLRSTSIVLSVILLFASFTFALAEETTTPEPEVDIENYESVMTISGTLVRQGFRYFIFASIAPQYQTNLSIVAELQTYQSFKNTFVTIETWSDSVESDIYLSVTGDRTYAIGPTMRLKVTFTADNETLEEYYPLSVMT